jgi:tRNA (guanine6-N2)-methyltransferase
MPPYKSSAGHRPRGTSDRKSRTRRAGDSARADQRGHQPAQRAEAQASPRLKFGPRLFIAHSQPGLEGVVANEVAARIAGGREIARRFVPERAGWLIFEAPRADDLAGLRTAEDIFALVGYAASIKGERAGLEQIRAMVRGAQYLEDGLRALVIANRGNRAGRRLRFRVVARVVGLHEFRRVDFQRAVETAMAERGDHSWRLVPEEADVEIWATLIGAEAFLAIRLTDESMRHREYKAAHRPASLRPSVAAAMAWLSEPRDDDIVLDPLCGAGTILVERAQLGRYAQLLGGDNDREALAAARTNVGPRYKPIEIRAWDAVAMPLDAASVSAIITNLPWGRRVGSHTGNRSLYPRLIAEFKRVLRPDGRMVMLTGETGLMRTLIARGLLRARTILNVSILGAPAAIYVCGA